MLAQVLPPSLLHGQVLPRKHQGLPLGDVIVLKVQVLIDGVHLTDLAILNRIILLVP
jgi:hypothetical protein